VLVAGGRFGEAEGADRAVVRSDSGADQGGQERDSMSEKGNDEAAGRTPPEPPPYGTPTGQPVYGTPPDQPAYGTPAQPGTTQFDPVPPTAVYRGPEGYPGQPPYPAQGYQGQWPAYPESSQAVLALILGIVGLFVFWPVAPFAWVIGRSEVRAVDAGRRDPSNRGVALAGQIMGIIGTVLLVLGVALFIILIVVAAAIGSGNA
jgi:hypothetical protein